MSLHASGNLALLLRRYLLRGVPAPLAGLVEAAGPAALRALLALDRLAAGLLPKRRDAPFLELCADVELCAMAGLLEAPRSLRRPLARALARAAPGSGRDVLPRLLLRRLEGRGLRLEAEGSDAFVADLLQLAGDLPALEVDAFLARPECVAGRLDRLAEAAGRWADGEVEKGERPVAGFLALLEHLDDLRELIESAENRELRSALWHHRAGLLDRARVRAGEIAELARELAEQPEIDADAALNAAAALEGLGRERWAGALEERLEALSPEPETRPQAAPAAAPALPPRRETLGRSRLFTPETVVLGVAAMALVLVSFATWLYVRSGGVLPGTSLLHLFETTGWPTPVGLVMAALAGLAILALAVAVERLMTFQRAKIDVDRFLLELRRALSADRSLRGAIAVCQRYPGPLASVTRAALLKYGRSKEEIEEMIQAAAVFELGRLERGLGLLAATANVAPLLGFFGTVAGMIHSFDALSLDLADPQAVAAGISQALVTTALGLAIAIPALGAFYYFTSRVAKTAGDVEVATGALLETLEAAEPSPGLATH